MVDILAADENPLIPPLGEIIIGIIAFSVVVIVMMRLVAPRFEQVFRARREALERYRAQLAEARTEAAQIRDQARAEGQQILEQLRAQAQEESARIVARGEEQLANARQQVVNELRGQIGALAVDLAGRVVGESLDDEARRRGTVDRFLDQLDGMAAGSPDGGRGSTAATPGIGR
jgi:F-type H+-transporting ATPase subunit b